MPEAIENLELRPDLVLQALARSLETMAFASPAPPAATPPPAPSSPCRVSITYRGPRNGTLELVSGMDFGRFLASNILGVDPSDEQAAIGAADALKELVNVTCGVLLPTLPVQTDVRFRMDVPQLAGLSEAEWDRFAARPGVAVLEVEGHPLAVQISEGHQS